MCERAKQKPFGRARSDAGDCVFVRPGLAGNLNRPKPATPFENSGAETFSTAERQGAERQGETHKHILPAPRSTIACGFALCDTYCVSVCVCSSIEVHMSSAYRSDNVYTADEK